ncbi:SDR family oxidoreductase [Halorarum halophilum]|uniref:SDR family oxidoreductase n=1 Tax=Halorarum halophilum TaxID=2743090 RepID=A0A7D5GEG2_9EURY|nr:SDR family oxidoreductase [Halobaculum halophilum]QLG27328.1 SDR family oxidoreductase [Halobaculum halophilum]
MTSEFEHVPVSVAGKTAVVVGGTSGIGRAIARAFAADGADVVASSRTEERVEETTAELRSLEASSVAVTCDVTDRDSLVALYEATADEFGGVDVLVNSPSAIARRGLLDVTEEEWASVLGVQLTGVVRTCQTFARRMDGGSLVNISSLSSVVTMADLVAYSTAKGAIDAFTRNAAKELAPEIRVNAIRPGYVATPQTADAYAEGSYRYERIRERAPMGRMADPGEIAGAAIYLASDAASYTTGEILTVDGGFAASAFE